MDIIRDYAGLFAVLISIGATLYAWLTAGSKANTAALAELDKCIDEHEKRIGAIETEWRHLPSKDGMHRLELALGEVRTEVASMAAAAQATERTARRVEDFLMKNGGGGS